MKRPIRYRKIIWSASIFLGILVLVFAFRWLGTLLFERNSQEVRFLAQDWRTIEFITSLTEDGFQSDSSKGLIGYDVTGGGAFQAESQRVFLGVAGLTGNENDEYEYKGGFAVTIEDVEIKIIDISGYEESPGYDSETGHYYFSLQPVNHSGNLVKVKVPFEIWLDGVFNDLVVYKSKKPETLTLSLIPPEEERAVLFPSLEIYANQPMTLFLSLRRGCQEKFSRGFDPFSNQHNVLIVHEDCRGERDFPYPYMEETDRKTKAILAASSPILETDVMVIYPQSFRISTHKEIVSDSAQNYLILLKSSSGVWADIVYSDFMREFVVSPAPTIQYSEEELVVLRPNTREIDIRDVVGNITLGVNVNETNELSDVTFSTAGLLDLSWQSRVKITELGQPLPQQRLVVTGVVNGVRHNGQQLLQNRWERIIPENQGAFIGGALGILGVLAGIFVDRIFRRPSDKNLANSRKQKRVHRSNAILRPSRPGRFPHKLHKLGKQRRLNRL